MRYAATATKRTLLGLLLATMAGCASQTEAPPTWPDLTVIRMSDGGVCLPPEDARRLAAFRAELERL